MRRPIYTFTGACPEANPGVPATLRDAPKVLTQVPGFTRYRPKGRSRWQPQRTPCPAGTLLTAGSHSWTTAWEAVFGERRAPQVLLPSKICRDAQHFTNKTKNVQIQVVRNKMHIKANKSVSKMNGLRT